MRKSRWFSSKLWLNHVSLIIFFFSSKFFWERNYYLIGRLAKNLILETICLFHFVRVSPRENVETKKSNQKFIFCLSLLFLVQLESVMRQNIRRLSFQYLFFYLETIFFLAWWWWFLQVFVQIFSFGFPLSKLAWKKDTKMNRYILCDKYSLQRTEGRIWTNLFTTILLLRTEEEASKFSTKKKVNYKLPLS